MQLNEIGDAVTEIGGFLASVGAIAYVIKRVEEFLTWRFFFFLISITGIIYIHEVYIESELAEFLASLLSIEAIFASMSLEELAHSSEE